MILYKQLLYDSTQQLQLISSSKTYRLYDAIDYLTAIIQSAANVDLCLGAQQPEMSASQQVFDCVRQLSSKVDANSLNGGFCKLVCELAQVFVNEQARHPAEAEELAPALPETQPALDSVFSELYRRRRLRLRLQKTVFVLGMCLFFLACRVVL